MKIFLIIISLVFAPVVAYALAFAYTFTVPYFKVTDPADPRFNPENFRFEDYYWIQGDNQKVHDAIYATFKKGMSKEKADNILIGKLKCSSKDVSDYLDRVNEPEMASLVHYYCRPWWQLPWWLQNPVDGLSFHARLGFDQNAVVVSKYTIRK